MSYQTLLFELADGVATVTLNRPERMNAWNDTMQRELSLAMKRCDEDDAVRAVVVTGAGRAFCAGLDMQGGDPFGGGRGGEGPGPAEPDRTYGALFPWQIRKPVVAAMNGHGIGVGATYPLTCDIRYVAEDAKLQFAFVQRGVLPELWSHAILPRVVGLSNAADLLLTGRVFRGREMAELGLASAALPAEQVLPAALDKARELAAAAPAAVALAKRLLWEGLGLGLDELGRREWKAFRWISQQPDGREGVMAFLEKRPPQWKLSPRDLPDDLP